MTALFEKACEVVGVDEVARLVEEETKKISAERVLQ